jgi:DNA-binding NtrC family response regulator
MDMPTPLRVLIAEAAPEGAYDVLRELGRAGLAPFAQVVSTPAELDQLLGLMVWDVLISDAGLPGLGPAAAVQAVRARGLDVPLIALGRTAGEGPAVEAMRAGACEYFFRDRLVDRLGPAVEREVAAAGERRARREKLLAPGQPRSIDALASALRHELSNPLSSVMSNLAYLREELAALRERGQVPTDAQWRDLDEAAADTMEGAQRIRDLVGGLGAFAAGE